MSRRRPRKRRPRRTEQQSYRNADLRVDGHGDLKREVLYVEGGPVEAEAERQCLPNSKHTDTEVLLNQQVRFADLRNLDFGFVEF